MTLERIHPVEKTHICEAQEHLGMGLNICKVLCEKHGGFLTLKNKGGAAVTAAFRAV